jgi:glycolate oxidase
MAYNSVDNKIVNALQAIVGTDNVITDKEALENYSHDETPIYHAMPEVAVKPSSTQEVSKILERAYEHTIAVTARGGGTSLSAGAVPIHGGIVLSLELMNRVKEIDKNNLMVVVEPGIITEQLGKELSQHGLFFPPDPVSLDSCTIGGNIAENAGGPRAMKYGVTKNYVTGLEVVLADGTIIRLGGKLYKNVTGYDLIDVLIGSEGTLAVVTEATLKVLPLPKIVADLLIPFKCVEDASQFSLEISQEDIMPAAIEFMDGDVYRMVEKYLKHTLPFSEASAHIIVELDGSHKEQIQKMYNRVGDIALKYGCLDVFVGESIKDKEKIWEPRKNIGDALKDVSKVVAREDLVVPKDRIPRLISMLKECVKKYNAHLFTFGHLGDGNIHSDIAVIDDSDNIKDYSDKKWVDEMRRKIYEITLSLGGTITAEHGIGLSKIPYLSMALDKTQIEIMKKIKDIFDPKHILNPGKIFTSQ